MPQEIDLAFQAAGTSLFPQQRAQLETDCSCPDYGDPCKHIAATHYVLGEALDRDPFLLFELRGRSKERVLAALRAARSGAASSGDASGARKQTRGAKPATRDASASESSPETSEIPAVALGKLAAADYDKPRAELPSLHFSFDPPAASGALLRQLGAPAAYSAETALADALAPLVRAASEAARKIALEVPGEQAERPAPAPPRSHPVSAAARARKPRRGRP
jgi:uncharacterized Zn finger protein